MMMYLLWTVAAGKEKRGFVLGLDLFHDQASAVEPLGSRIRKCPLNSFNFDAQVMVHFAEEQ